MSAPSRPATKTWIGTVERTYYETYEMELPVGISEGAAWDALLEAVPLMDPTDSTPVDALVLDMGSAGELDDGPTDDAVYNRFGMEGGIGYSTYADDQAAARRLK